MLTAFPELFVLAPDSNGQCECRVEDPELAAVIGSTVRIHFDTGGRVLDGDVGVTIP